VNGVLGGCLAPESFVLSQSFYIGGVEGGTPVETYLVEGDFIDQRADLDAIATGEPELYTPQPGSRDLSKLSDVALWAAYIPNNDLDWSEWSTIGMAIFAATGGSDDGLEIFHVWSQKSKKYRRTACVERWKHWHRHPPNRLSGGKLFHLATKAIDAVVDSYESEGTGEVDVDAIREGAAQ